MKSVACTVFVFLLVFLPAVEAIGQTVMVDAGLGSVDRVTTFTSIQEAIGSFASGGVNSGSAAVDVINVATGAVVDDILIADAEATGAASDALVLSEPLTIQGDGGMATIALQMSDLGSTGDDCGLFWRQGTDLVLRDLIFIPSSTHSPTDDALYFRQKGDGGNVTITIENVVITSATHNAPVTLTGLDRPDLAGLQAVTFGGGGIYVVSRSEGGTITLNAQDFVVSSFCAGGANDGLTAYMAGPTQDILNCRVNLGPGCVISNGPRFGIQVSYGSHVRAYGADDAPILIANVEADGVWLNSDSNSPTQASVFECGHLIVAGCGAGGIKEQETRGRGFIKSVTHTILAYCDCPGLEFYAAGTLSSTGGVADAVTIEHVTIHQCGTAPTAAGYDFREAAVACPTYNSTYKTNRDLVISDAIISGTNVGVYNSSDGVISIDYSALVTQNLGGGHTYSLALPTLAAGTSVINLGAGVISDNPHYTAFGEADFALASFLNVENEAFAGKGSDGSDLSGGADHISGFTPPTTTGLVDWAGYR